MGNGEWGMRNTRRIPHSPLPIPHLRRLLLARTAAWITVRRFFSRRCLHGNLRGDAMPGFKIHISASTTLGIAYGGAAFAFYDVPAPTAALATVLCSVAGMLPDLDSGPAGPCTKASASPPPPSR